MTQRLPLAWGAHVSAEFRERVWRMCDQFGWGPEQPSDLMAAMAFESAETFAPDVRNAAGSGAVGLIQFMPLTAHAMGTTTLRMMAMSAVEQLDSVERYFRPYHTRVRTLSDLYMAILLPSYVGAPEDAVLFWTGTAYRQNSGLDSNHDGKITKAEAAAHVLAKRTRGMQPGFVFNPSPDFTNVQEGATTTAPRTES